MIDQLYFKHFVATSPLAGAAEALRGLSRHCRNLSSPELGLLREEGTMMATVLKAHVRPDSNCLDIGAHVGSMSYRLLRLAPKGRHTLIEAVPRKAAWLARRFPDAVIHNVAVGDRSGEVSFYENLARPGFSSLTDSARRGETREIRVTCARIDDLVPDDERVDFLKIDVEGHELEALRGAARLLRRCAPVILFEAGGITARNADHDPSAGLFDFLTRELGYQINPVYGAHHRQPPIDGAAFARCRTYPFLAFNFIALPPSGQSA